MIKNQEDYDKYFPPQVQQKALETALDTRKFEIDMYWKRATYFWAFIAATFAAYFLLLSSKNFEKIAGFSIVIAAIGFFFSVGWYFVNRGSKFWQENWEKHVDFLGLPWQGPLFTCVTVKKDKFHKLHGAYPFSVSKVNQILSLMMVLFWLSTFIFSIFLSFGKLYYINSLSCCWFTLIFAALIILLFLGYKILRNFTTSSFIKKLDNKGDSVEFSFIKDNSPIPVSYVEFYTDELIHYVKNHNQSCKLTDNELLDKIWDWLKQVDPGASCWQQTNKNKKSEETEETRLKVYKFRSELLPDLFNYLSTLYA